MPARLHPGVYVEEVPSPAKAIEAASTSTAIFVGETEFGPVMPTRIKGRGDYERLYGGYLRRTGANGAASRVPLAYAITAFFRNGGTTAYILRSIVSSAVTGSRTQGGLTIDAASPGSWSLDLHPVFCASSDGSSQRFRIAVVRLRPGTTTLRVEEIWDRLSVDPNDENFAPDVLARSQFVRWRASNPLTVPNAFDESSATATEATILANTIAAAGARAMTGGTLGEAEISNADLGVALNRLDEITDASLLVLPARFPAPFGSATDGGNVTYGNIALSYAEGRPQLDLFCIADLPRLPNLDPTGALNAITGTHFTNVTPKTTFGAVYFPWVEVSDPVGTGRDPAIMVPPSGFVAGLYARTDARRGVWKAPAGLDASLLEFRRIEYNMLDRHQDDLNPIGVNLIRLQPQGGVVVWGARTLRPATEWRYINVRRMAMFLRKSIYNGIQFAVFENNDETLWASLRLVIEGFMEQLFRQGAFFGSTTKEAFFVKVDSETTPEPDRIAGIVNIWVGFAPQRPAEFVVVKLSQIVGQKP